MKKIRTIIAVVSLGFLLTACRIKFLTADTLPWVGDEKILFKDDFSQQTGGWTVNQDAFSYSGYDQGGFRIQVDMPGYQFWSVPGLNFENVHIFTQSRKLGGTDDNIFGVLCRYQNPENYYALVISSDGYYGVYKVVDGSKTLIDQPNLEFSEVIQRGNAVNVIQGVCKDEILILVVNDVRLIQVQDGSLAYGDVGLIAGNFSKSNVNVVFDHFIVAKP
jgi:hypothetical protein